MVQVTLIAPPTQIQTLGAGGQQAQSATQNGMPSATYLSPGALVAGIITGKDAGGSYMLKTDQGTFTLHSNTPLTYNSDVLIRIDNSNEGSAGARIISVNGEAFSTFSTPAQPESDSLSPSLLAKAGVQNAATVDTPDTPLTPAKPVAIPAVIVPTPASATPSPQVQIPAGTQVVLNPSPVPDEAAPSPTPASPAPATAQTATTTTPPQATNAATTAATPPATSSTAPAPATTPVAPQTNAPLPAPPATPPTLLPAVPANVAKLIVSQPQALSDPSAPSTFFTATPAATSPPAVQSTLYAAYAKLAAPAPANATASSTALLNASVVANNPDGTVTLQTTQGTVTVKPENLPALAKLPAGTALTVTLPAMFAYLTSNADALPEDSLLSTLRQALTTLQGKAPAAATELLNRLPSMGSDFISSSLSFISALLSGNGRKILGENAATALQNAGADDMVGKFTAHAAGAAQAFQQSGESAQLAPNWQSLVLPFVYQGTLQEARIYVKRDGSRKTGDGKKTMEDTRFIVEITFDDLGELQLDGIVLPKEKGTIFDLIVRSQTAFLPEEKQEITQIYANAAELTGFQGSIGFNVTKDFPIKPLAEMHAMPARDIIA